jgi:DNA-binding LytR/AlgR family response regulator
MCVLIVEDEFLVAAHLEDVLAELGYTEIHVAGDLDEGHRLLERVAPHFAILDVNVGSALVFPLAAELQKRRIPFVFSSGNALSAFPPEWRTHPFVPKPLQKHVLAAALHGFGLLPHGRPDGS